MGLRYYDYSLIQLKEYIEHYTNTPGFGSPNIFLIALSLLIIAGTFFLGQKLLERKPSFKHYDPNDYPDRLKGANGLLMLAKIILIGIFVMNCVNFYLSLYYYGSNPWDFLTANNLKYPSPLWPLTIIFITTSNLLLLLYSIFIVIVEFTKKRIFKFVVITYLYLILIIAVTKYFLFSQVFESSHEVVYQSFIYMSFLLQITIVISAYIGFSRRVNATFSN